MMNAPELIATAEAAQRSGLPLRTLYNRIRRDGIPLFQDGRDRRMRLIDVQDLEHLMAIQPAPRRKTATTEAPR